MNVGLIVGMILTIVVIGLFVPFGIKSAGKLMDANEQAIYSKVYKDLEYNLQRVYKLQEGSTIKFKIEIPSMYKFCFVNPENYPKDGDGDGIYESTYPDYTYAPRVSEIQDRNWVYFNETYLFTHPDDRKYKSLLDQNIKPRRVSSDETTKGNNLVVFKDNRPEQFLYLPGVVMKTSFCAERGMTLTLKNKGDYVEMFCLRDEACPSDGSACLPC